MVIEIRVVHSGFNTKKGIFSALDYVSQIETSTDLYHRYSTWALLKMVIQSIELFLKDSIEQLLAD